MWRTVKLGDVATVIAGQSPAGENYNKDGVGTPFMQGKKDYGDKFPNPPTVWTTSVTKLAEKGDILMSVRAPVGALNIANQQVCIGRGLAAIRASEKIELDYLFYALLQISARLEGSSGAIFNSINKKQIEEIEFLLPPLAEQQRIVAKLDAAFTEIDDAVEATNEQLKNSSLIALAWLREKFAQDESDSKTLSLFGGLATTKPKDGWEWHKLTDIAKLESGHTPSRRHPEYWGGEIKWVGIKDARKHHAGVIFETEQQTNELGIKNSSARLLPKDTVCLSRTASVGYVFRLGEPMATSQDFINWVCNPSLQPEFLQLLFLAEDEAIKRFGSGAVHKTIYFDTAKEFHVCIPSLERQSEIIAAYTPIIENSKTVIKSTKEKITALTALKSAILTQELRSEAA
jgi:type I restriction enzyme S subunit